MVLNILSRIGFWAILPRLNASLHPVKVFPGVDTLCVFEPNDGERRVGIVS
jgi:hypothetical protein